MKTRVPIPYSCSSKEFCAPVSMKFQGGTLVVFELWGGQGGNITGSSEGGRGGYAMGKIRFSQETLVYFFIGSSGAESFSGFTTNSYNGGGKGIYTANGKSAASGGGATDIRLDYSFSSRLLVAGGGSGASIHYGLINPGACGGGLTGGQGNNGNDPNTIRPGGNGGTQTGGGSSACQNGASGFGGNQTSSGLTGSGGGGGYFGGGSGISWGATGGGGSGFANSSAFISTLLLSGCEYQPSFYNNSQSFGHQGNGAVRVTFIHQGCSHQNKKHSIILFAFQILLSFSISSF